MDHWSRAKGRLAGKHVFATLLALATACGGRVSSTDAGSSANPSDASTGTGGAIGVGGMGGSTGGNAGNGGSAIGGNVYWAEQQQSSRLMRRSLAGGEPATLIASPQSIMSPLSDGADIDYAAGNATPADCRGRVMAVPKAGDMPARQIAPGWSGIGVLRLVRDESHIYWASNTTQGAVLRARKGETPEILAANQQGADGLALNATNVYWFARTAATGYEVRTLPK